MKTVARKRDGTMTEDEDTDELDDAVGHLTVSLITLLSLH